MQMLTACGHRMAHRKWKDTKQQPSMLPGPAVPGSSLVSFHFLWAILCPQAVLPLSRNILTSWEMSEMSPIDSVHGGTLFIAVVPPC